jgi:prefoldin subunit 5
MELLLITIKANVMVEYNFDEAIELLNSNKNNALKSLERIETEMEFLKDQITTLEVSIQNQTHPIKTMKMEMY